MKKTLIAIAFSTCSVPAFADAVPPFVLNCSIARTPPSPITVKWDGRVLQMNTEGSKPGLEFESANPQMRVGQPPLNFVAFNFDGSSRQGHAYLLLSLAADASGKLRSGFYNLAFLSENRLGAVGERNLQDCTSTLDR